MAQNVAPAYAAPLPSVNPAGESFLEAVLVNDALTYYSGGRSLLSWGSRPALAVTAQAYFSQYQNNQIAADQMYQNKLIAISGTIDSVNNDQFNGPYVSFSVDGLGNWVYGYLDPRAISEAASYQAGQAVTLFCVSAGVLANIPQLQQCAGKQTLTARLQEDIHTSIEGWLTGGPFPYGNNLETKGMLFLVYESGKTLNMNDPDFDMASIFSNSQRLNEIFKIGANSPDAKADAVFLGLPLRSKAGSTNQK